MAAATEPLLVPGGRRAGSWSALSGSGRQKGGQRAPVSTHRETRFMRERDVSRSRS